MATHVSASASRADVLTAYALCSSGDTLVVPAVPATWTAGITITLAIKFQGAGIGSTVITSGIAGAYTYLVTYAPVAAEINKTFEMTGFTLDGSYTSGIFSTYAPSTSPVTGLKIHGNRFTNANSRAVMMRGLEFGVFYQNQFADNYIDISGYGAEGAGWDIPITLGGASYPYFEDNTIINTIARGGFIVETGRGARIVFRHNAVSNFDGAGGGEIWDSHGVNTTYPADRGTVAVEYYENTIGLASNNIRLFNHRGGVALAVNNAFSGGTGHYMTMTEYQGWSYCTLQTYPKYDQVNNSYYYGNTLNGGALTSNVAGNSGCSPTQQDSDFIQLNRDFFRLNPVGATILGSVYAAYTYPHPLRGEGATPYVRIY
jgi:hypothetical protein